LVTYPPDPLMIGIYIHIMEKGNEGVRLIDILKFCTSDPRYAILKL